MYTKEGVEFHIIIAINQLRAFFCNVTRQQKCWSKFPHSSVSCDYGVGGSDILLFSRHSHHCRCQQLAGLCLLPNAWAGKSSPSTLPGSSYSFFIFGCSQFSLAVAGSKPMYLCPCALSLVIIWTVLPKFKILNCSQDSKGLFVSESHLRTNALQSFSLFGKCNSPSIYSWQCTLIHLLHTCLLEISKVNVPRTAS